MPALPRRREQDRYQECWRIFYGDVQVGTIGERAGVPVSVDQWAWHCGFFPAIDRDLRADGTAMSFEQASADFADAWARYLPRCTEADFEEYRQRVPRGNQDGSAASIRMRELRRARDAGRA
jgi:hypothetical protein